MHPSSMEAMNMFLCLYLDKNQTYSILDVGSFDVNGTYKELIPNESLWKYTGMDIVPGNNVDIVGWDNIKYKYDVIISGQTLEHVKRPWDWLLNLVSHLKENGIVCIIAPHTFPEHRYPIDTYRYYPDGMRDLFEYAGIKELQIYKNVKDTIGIGERI